MRITIGASLAAAVVLLSAAAYHVGHGAGAEEARDAARDAQLRANAVQVAAIEPKIERAHDVDVVRKAKSDTARAEYSAARSQVRALELELPAPVIQLVNSADKLALRDSLTIVSATEWGELWKQKAELLEARVGLLEGQLDDERAGRRRDRIRDVVIAGVLGAAAGVILH